jgi:hypothetical protein
MITDMYYWIAPAVIVLAIDIAYMVITASFNVVTTLLVVLFISAVLYSWRSARKRSGSR